jgi:hypothetical protein
MESRESDWNNTYLPLGFGICVESVAHTKQMPDSPWHTAIGWSSWRSRVTWLFRIYSLGLVTTSDHCFSSWGIVRVSTWPLIIHCLVSCTSQKFRALENATVAYRFISRTPLLWFVLPVWFLNGRFSRKRFKQAVLTLLIMFLLAGGIFWALGTMFEF